MAKRIEVKVSKMTGWKLFILGDGIFLAVVILSGCSSLTDEQKALVKQGVEAGIKAGIESQK